MDIRDDRIALLREIAKQPGKWALFATMGTPASANNLAGRVRAGSFLPGFEATIHHADVLVRYIGRLDATDSVSEIGRVEQLTRSEGQRVPRKLGRVRKPRKMVRNVGVGQAEQGAVSEASDVTQVTRSEQSKDEHWSSDGDEEVRGEEDKGGEITASRPKPMHDRLARVPARSEVTDALLEMVLEASERRQAAESDYRTALMQASAAGHSLAEIGRAAGLSRAGVAYLLRRMKGLPR